MLKEFKNDTLKEFRKTYETQNKKIVELESTVSILQKHVCTIKSSSEKRIDEAEQYGRRLCMRFEGIPSKDKETSDQVLEFVKSKWEEAGVVIPNEVIDRAHRIGKPYINRETNVKNQAVIVRMTTFRHRTMVYRARKEIENKSKIKVRLDLTKTRYDVLKSANRLVKGVEKVKWVYADINCRLTYVE